MQSTYEKLRIAAVVALVFGGTVLPVALSRGPQLPAVQSVQAESSATSDRALLPRIVAQASAADGSPARAESETLVTVGPKTALRMHGGSVLTDFLTQ